MPRAGVDAFHCEGATFAMNIEDVLFGEDHVQVAAVPIRWIVGENLSELTT